MHKFLTPILSIILFLGISPLCTSCYTNTSKHQNSLKIAISHDPMSLDPRSACLSKDISIAQALYEGLVRERSANPEPALAQYYTISSDQTVYTFYLKEASWSNGDPVTAYDFEESIKQIHKLEVACSSNFLLGVIKNSHAVMSKQLPVDTLGIRAVNASQLEITLEKPIPHFLEILAYPIFFPVHKSLREFSASRGTKLPNITNGPFLIEDYQPQNKLIIKKNPLYHDKQAVHLDTITFQIVPDTHTATQLLQKNLIDWVGSPWSSPISKEDQHHIPKDKLHNYPVLGTTALICNLKHSPTNSLALRKALAYAIDKTTLLQFISHGKVAEHFLPPELSKLPKQSHQSPEERKELARAYFKEAEKELSLKYIAELSIIYPLESACLNAIVQEIQQQIKKVLGIHVPIQGMEYHCFLDKRRRGDFTLATGRWIADYPRPTSFLSILGNLKNDEPTKSLTKWENAQYNHVLTTLLSKDETMKDQIVAEELIEEDLPIIPLYHFEYTYAANPKIQNSYTSLLGHIDLKEAEISK
ncbi:peptide ABC transporter substrate-binding protein [Chlamydia buteonis]|uniref:Peptide ABC transporter substrate-binding protein n=1 Tax=Chlamydia buteonis TaxID=2494525 RepID=A0ABX8L9M7_9CHLA|nr:peptide ABC transporter substrate-binding protein [Chlamydia buteonis]QXE27021.1 peptide ABC transporter substrate-binding protein [Chlamydia buteonis]QXE28039.1 peptide ABC transporter substrate-binding protein [Chlamydia buteonis]